MAASSKIQYYVAASLDGFIATEENSLDWLLQFGFEAYTAHYERFLSEVGALVMGASTYQFLLDQGLESWSYCDTPTWVLTHRELPMFPGASIVFASGDVAEVAKEARSSAQGKNVWLVGGGEVAAQFAEKNLLDELWLTIMPIALGSGKRVFPVSETTPILELVATTPFVGGATELRYRLG